MEGLRREGRVRETWHGSGVGGEEQGTTGEVKSFWMEQEERGGFMKVPAPPPSHIPYTRPVSEGRVNSLTFWRQRFTVDPSGHWSSE